MPLYEETKRIQQELDNKYNQDDPLKYLFSKLSYTNQSLKSAGKEPIPIDPEISSGVYLPKDSRNFGRFFGEVYDPTAGIENVAAGRQRGIERISYMLPRIGTKVLSEVAQLPGYLGGALAWGATGFDKDQVGLMVDNFWQKAVQSAEESMKGALPVYVSDKVKEGNLMQNIFSTSFWATEGADGIGFLLAYLVPGQVLKATGLGAKAARLIKPGNKISKLLSKGASYEDAITAATKGTKEAFDFVGATVINTLFESAAEGGETYRSILDKTGDTNKAAEAAVDVVNKNFGILLASNAVDQFWLFKDIKMFKKVNADNTANLAKKSIMDKLIDPKTNKVLSEIAPRTKWEKAGTLTKDFLAGLGKEGFFEEGMQFAASKQAEQDLEDPEANDRGFLDGLIDLGETYLESLSDTDMQKSIFLGGLLGGGMSMIHTQREQAAERRILEGSAAKTPSAFAKFFGARERKETPGLKQLLQRNMSYFHTTLSDLAEMETDKDGNIIPKLNPDGSYKLDPKKVEGLAEDKILDYAEKEKLISFSRSGNEEGFKYIKDKMEFRYMSLFLQQEGGINALMKHIDELSELEKEYFQKEGVDFNIDDIRSELKAKALRFQDIYNRVENTHDLLMDDVKLEKGDKVLLKEFSDLVKSNKFNEERTSAFADSRISALRRELADLKYNDTTVPVTSDQNNLSDNLVGSLKESYNAQKDQLSDASRKQTERIIDNIEEHQKELKVARDYSSKLYNKTWLNKTFKEYKERKKEVKASPVDGNKAEEAIKLSPKLRALYDKAVIMEEFDEPIKAVARHSGDVQVIYTDQEGKSHKVVGRITGPSVTGNLRLKANKEEVNGKLVNVEDGTAFFINENETIGINKETFKINDIQVVKQPEEVLKERRNTKLLEALRDQLGEQRSTVRQFKQEIILQHKYIEELKEKSLELEVKELELLERTGKRLTSKGTARKISVGTAVASKNYKTENKQIVENKKRQFLNAEELQRELKNAIAVHDKLVNDLAEWDNNRKRIIDLIKTAKTEGNFYKLFDKEVELANQAKLQMQKAIDKDQELIDNSTIYLKRLHSTLKGYFTSFASVLGLTPQLITIRNNPELTPEEIEEESLSLISNALSSIELTDKILDDLALLPTMLDRVQTLIEQKEFDIQSARASLSENQLKLQELAEISNMYSFITKKYEDAYLKYIGDLGIIEEVVDKSIQDADSPEDSIDGLRDREEEFTRKFEKDFKHPFVDKDSFLVTGGDQTELMKGSQNDDLARWYIFVNKMAHQGKNKKYILKSFTVSQVAKLKEDDPIRKHLKFYAGKLKGIKQYVTYSQLINLPTENQKIAEDDIKVVVHDQDAKPLMVSKQVLDNNENKYYLLYNSLLENDKNIFGERFSRSKAIADRIAEMKYPVNDDESKKRAQSLAEAYVDEKYEKDWKSFLSFRDDLKKSSYFFGINFINPGVKNYSGASEIELSEFTGVEDISQLANSITIHKIGERRTDKRDKSIKKGNYGHRITRQFSGAEHGVTSGYAYLGWDNRFELIKPRTLGETGSVEDILSIIRYLATNPKDYEEVEKFLHKLIYLNANNKKYRIYFTKFYGPDKTKRGFRTLLFGDNEISAQDLASGENLEELRNFLSNKLWNIDDESLKATSFTEYKVTWNKNKPVVTSKLWDIKQGSYVGFLFNSDSGNRVPRGTVNAKKAEEKPLDNVRNGQFINQSLSLKSLGTAYKKQQPEATNKTKTDPQNKKPSSGGGLRGLVKDGGAVSKDKVKLGRNVPTETQETKESSKKTTSLRASFGIQTAPDSADNTAEPVDTTTNAYKTPKDLWNSFTPEARKAYVDRFKKSEEEVMKYVFQAYSSNQGDINRTKNDSEKFIQEELDDKISWFKEKFPKIPIESIDDKLIDSWGKLTKDGKVLISDLAAEGTIYHEAYHTYSLLFQNELDRVALYNEVRKRLGKEMSDKQAEEFLAEEFRMYMNSPNEYKFNKGDELQKNWFEKLLDYILEVLKDFNIIKSDKPGWRIEETFNKINTTNSFEISDEELKERVKNIRETYNSTRTIEGLSEKETMYYVQDFNYNFFQALFDPKSVLNPDTLFDLNVNIDELYNTIYTFYELKKKLNPSYEKIYDHFTEIKDLHKKFLKRYGISLSDDHFVKENEVEGAEIDEDERAKARTDILDSTQVNMNELIDNPIRMVIAGLPAVTLVNNMVKANLSEYLTRSTTKYNSILNILRDNMATLTSIEEMAGVMESLSGTYPELTILLKRLGLSDNTKKATTQQVALQNQFYKNFSMNKNIPVLYNYGQDGKKYQVNAVDNNVSEKIKNEWLNNARVNAITKVPVSYVYKTKTGEYLISKKTLQKDLEYYSSLDKIKRLPVAIDILSGLGITLPMIDNPAIDQYLFWLGESLLNISEEKLSIFGFYNADIIKAQKEFNNLLKYASTIFINNKDLSYFNQDGNREFSVTLNSYLSNIVNQLNNLIVNKEEGSILIPQELEYLMGWDNDSETGSLFNRNSKWLDLLRSGQKLDLVLLKGLISPTEGIEISKLTLGDYKSVTFNALLQGIVPFLRSADRKLEYGFRIGTVNANITNDIFRETLRDYLKDELATSFALLLDKNNWGGRLKNYSENAKQLRVFNFLHKDLNIPSLEDFVEDNKSKAYLSIDPLTKRKSDTVNEADRLVDKFFKVYDSTKHPYITRNFDNYIQDLQNMTFESLEEDNLIVKEQHGRGSKIFKYSVPGIDVETLEKMGIVTTKKDKTISEESMKRLVRLATYNSFVGNNEQLKLFLGDLAYYRNAVDFHKRTTGATSTKYGQRDDLFIREHLDENFRRFDNKSRTDSMSLVIVEDNIVNNESLAKLHPAYAECNGTDAQSWMMLDEYRDVMLRHGLWYPKHERTYQYEMQKFALRLLKLIDGGRTFKIDKQKLIDQFTHPTGTFFKHTKGIIPEVPLYNGIELIESSLRPLSILKPQGFGHITNDVLNGLNATTYWKTSAAPIFMSAISEDSPMFDFLVDMIANQQGVLTFSNYGSGSAIKADLLGNENGKIQRIFEQEEYFSQNIRYRDFGIQLDIHEESEGEVSISTQRTRLEFLDIFDQGIAVKNENLVANRHEYTKITGDIESQLRTKLLNDLGIVKSGDTYVLPEDNYQKFSKRLVAAFENRQLPLNIIDGIEIALDPKIGLNVFDLSLSKFKIEEILTSMVRNELIKRKVTGEMLIQESSFLYENPNSTERLLEFYKRTFPDGKKKDPVITPMQVMIAIPRSMLKYVDSIGGIDKLNEALDNYYKTGDYGILGEDFIDLLTMPANRIPGQSLSSLDIIQVRRFLPHYHGNKIVIPAEATVKAGSDFDVDKLTVYFNEFFEKDGKLNYNYNDKSIAGKQNRLNTLAEKSLLDPERFLELITPLDSKYLKSKANKIRESKEFDNEVEARSTNPQMEDVIHWWYNMQKGYEFWTSKSGVATVAVQNAAHAIEQNHPLTLNNAIPLMFAGQELGMGESYKSGFIKDSSGRFISNNFAEFLTAFVDAVKDPFVFEITNNETFAAIAALNRFGKDASVGLDSIIEFYSQPVIKDYIKIKRVNSARYMFFNQYNVGRDKWEFNHRLNKKEQYRTILQTLSNKLKPTINIPISYDKSVSAAVEEYIQERTRVYKTNESLEEVLALENDVERANEIRILTDNDKNVSAKLEEIYKRIENSGYKYLSLQDLESVKSGRDASGKPLSNDELFKLQVQILDNYMMYDQLGWNLVTINSLLRPDASSSFGRHLASIDTSINIPAQTIQRRGLFDYTSVLQAIAGTEENPSLIYEFFETKQNTSSYYNWSSLINKSPIVKKFFEDNVYSVLANPARRLSRPKVEAALETIESDFISFLLVKMLGSMSNEEIQKTYKDIFQGNNSIAQQLLRMKSSVKGNLALDELEAVISKKINKSQSISELDNISLFSKQFDPNQWDAMEADIYDLYNSTTDNKAFVQGLIYLSIFQSGYKKSPISFSEIIPNRIFIPMAAVALKQFDALADGDKLTKLNTFLEQMYRNNADNKDIVTRNRFPVDFKQNYIVDKKRFHKNVDFLTANMYIGDPNEYWNSNRKAPMTVALYKRISPTEFQLISKLGDSMRFKEYYPDATIEEIDNLSILDSNFLQFNMDNPLTNDKDTRVGRGKVVEEDEEIHDDESHEGLYFSTYPQKYPQKKQSKMKIEYYKGFWNRSDVSKQTNKVFLFGDNTEDRTKTHYIPSSTQAVIRGLPNAIGIDTKKNRNTIPSSYLSNEDFEWFKKHVDTQIQKAKDTNKIIVLPTDGIGTGKAMLKEKAPKLFTYLQNALNNLESSIKKNKNRYGVVSENSLNINIINGKSSYATIFSKETTLHQVLRSIENNSENESHITLAQAIREEIRQPIPLEIFDDAWREANPDDLGEYDGYTEITEKFGLPNKIGIYDQLDNRSFEVVTLHEGIHALTIMRYKTDPIFRNKINDLFKHVKDYTSIKTLEDIFSETTETIESLERRNNTLLKDEYEFISEALTNPEYQELLSTIPAYDKSNIKDLSKSVFRQFIESIFDLLSNFFARHPESINDLPQSAFKELISLVDDTLTRPNEVLDNLDLNKTAEENELIRVAYKKSNKDNNEFELDKENELSFEKLYPDYSYLTKIEQETFQDAVDKGEIELACGI